MIKAIIFDCFGVLATDIWLQFCDSLPADADRATLSALNHAFDKGVISEEDFIAGVKETSGRTPPLLEHMDPAGVHKNTALLTYVAELSKTYKIGILSNISSDWIQEEFLTADELTLFDAVTLSYEVGVTKPDPRIYHAACTRLGVLPEEAIMIDDRQGNVDGAERAGMTGILYDNFHDFKSQLEPLLNTNS